MVGNKNIRFRINPPTFWSFFWQEPILNTADIVPYLQSQEHSFNPEGTYFKFKLKGELTPKQLRQCLDLPYELSIYKIENSLFLTTGTRHYVPLDDQRDNLSFCDWSHTNMSFHLHTHPIYHHQMPKNTPSFSDIRCTNYGRNGRRFGLAHVDGLMLYQRPNYNSMTGETYRDDIEVEDIILKYGESHGIDVLGHNMKGLKVYDNLSRKEQMDLERNFVQDTRMIVAQASWDDEQGLESVLSQMISSPTKKS